MRIFCTFLFSQYWNWIHILLITHGRLFERCMLCFQFPFCTWKLKGKSFLLRKNDPFVKFPLVNIYKGQFLFINQWLSFSLWKRILHEKTNIILFMKSSQLLHVKKCAIIANQVILQIPYLSKCTVSFNLINKHCSISVAMMSWYHYAILQYPCAFYQFIF